MPVSEAIVASNAPGLASPLPGEDLLDLPGSPQPLAEATQAYGARSADEPLDRSRVDAHPWTGLADSGACTGDPDLVVQTDDPAEDVLPVSALRLCEPGPASLDGTWGEQRPADRLSAR